MKMSIIVLVIILLAIVCPFLVVWSINHLFLKEIPYDLKSWFAIVILSASINYSRNQPSVLVLSK